MINSFISGSGSYLPKKILANSDLEKIIDTSDEWIASRTGIKQRHIAADDEYTSDMAVEAAKAAIENANLSPENIDLIIVATTTSDKTFPSTATIVQSKLNIKNCASFDIQAVCSGFVYGLSVADNFIKTGKTKNALVIGSEKMSSIIDWTDRNTCVLFGDGAGAVILSAEENGENYIIDSKINSDGNFEDILFTNGGTSTTQTSGKIKMQGKEVFKHAVDKMSKSITEILKKNNFVINDIKYLIPHQANIRILEAISKKIKIPNKNVISTVSEQGNTSAASIPLAIDKANRNNYLKKGDLIVLTALGGGLTWGSTVLKWNK